jgi:hypothetical protein
MTKREMFVAIREVVVDNADMVAFIDKEIALLDKKRNAPKKLTETQLENERCKADIIAYLIEVDQPKNISEIQADVASVATFSNQRITHILSALVADSKVTKTYIKKRPYFSIA